MRSILKIVGAGAVGFAIFSVANCSADPEPSAFQGVDAAKDEAGNPIPEDSGPRLIDPETGFFDTRRCVGLECYQGTCAAGSAAPTTTVTGTVFAPEGTIPLYNAIVYVPNATPEPFKTEVVCEACGKVTGNPVVTALTNEKGQFKLENVPWGNDIPLVVEIGKWRRQLKIPTVKPCEETKVDPATTRLPRTQAEGDIPKIALSTGKKDSLECFLRKIGIADSEFTNPDKPGRVHYYSGNGSTLNASTPAATGMWSTAATLKQYDLVLLGCEGALDTANKSPYYSVMSDYMAAGGKVFATHFHYAWFAFANGTTGLPSTADYNPPATVSAPPYKIDTTLPPPATAIFPKGASFADWLVNVGASTTKGDISLLEVKDSVGDSSSQYATRWIHSDTPKSAKYFSFNTPVGLSPDKQCGRGVFTDVHVGGAVTYSPATVFPTHCTTTGLNADEKALFFLFFDLSSCIQDETKAPIPPPPIPK